MAKKVIFAPGEYYHIYSRVMLKMNEFEDNTHSNKLAQNFLLSNSTNSTAAFDYLRNTKSSKFEKAVEIARDGKRLVDVVCYSIMPNHYHLMLRELQDGGISNFVRKCNIATSKYINIKNNRVGPLFESRFKSKHVKFDDYLLHLSLYIHLNPLDFLIGKSWRKGKLKGWEASKTKLLGYPWSSLKSFLSDKHNDLIISGTDIIDDQFGKKGYESYLRKWSEGILDDIENIIID